MGSGLPLTQLASLVLGGLFGGGILLLVLGLTPVEPKVRVRSSLVHDLRRLTLRVGRRLPIAVLVGLLVLVITFWPVMAIGCAVLVFFWESLFGGAKSEKVSYARLEGLAAWTESLRDTIAGAVGLEQAIPATAEAAAPAIARPLHLLSDRLRVRVPMSVALQRFADDLDDPAADLVVAALVLNSRLRGPGLRDVLTSLSRSVRNELEMRGRVMASRRSTRRSVQIVVFISATFIIGLRVLNPEYVEPFGTFTGQIVLTVIIILFASGFLWLRRLATFEMPARFLGASESHVDGSPSTRPDARPDMSRGGAEAFSRGGAEASARGGAGAPS
jgi:Flp pilus assembly protein TadB